MIKTMKNSYSSKLFLNLSQLLTIAEKCGGADIICEKPQIQNHIVSNTGTFFSHQMNHGAGHSYIIYNLALWYNIENYSSVQIRSVGHQLF